ncbi:MAG: hypothetical protein ACFE7R_05260 [Candidatus Hodarchaeota archaeon]
MKEQNRRRVNAAILIIGMLAMFSGYIWLIQPPITPSLEHLPPPDEVPGYEVAPIVVSYTTLNASAEFFGFHPHQGPWKLGFTLKVNVTNMARRHIEDFHAVKATIFRIDLTPVSTFGIDAENATILSGETRILTYEESRYLSRDTYTYETEFFLRVLVTFDNDTEVILTTPLSWAGIAIE